MALCYQGAGHPNTPNVVDIYWARKLPQENAWREYDTFLNAASVIHQFVQRADMKRAQAEAARQAADAAKRAADERRAEREAFSRKFGIDEWVNPAQLIANPFLYKGKIVAVRANFTKMVAEQEGMFDNLIVSKVPTTEFKGNESAVLVVKVKGTRELKGNTIPDVEYVGDRICKVNGCGDFMN